MTRRSLPILALVLSGAMLALDCPAADKVPAAPEQVEWWRLTIRLDHPSLSLPAVQWAIMDADPVPGFKAGISRRRDDYDKEVHNAKNARERTLKRSIQMMVNWDRGFKKVTGDELYLLTPDQTGFMSSSPEGTKWIVTKVIQVEGQPVCWCIPVEVRVGKTINLTLTETNTFDLAGAYEDAMRQPTSSK